MRSLPAIQPGDVIGPYRVGPELGRGGIAVVHEATRIDNPKMGPLAIKVAHRTNELRDQRFIREFERLRVIALPGVARVYDAGTTDQLIWFVMDQIEGKPIHHAIQGVGDVQKRVAAAIDVGARLFDVLAGIHRMNFIHRDIKPSNILVSDRHDTHILDFGLVRLVERGDTMTRAGRLVGTVAFMSPEQTTGLPLTPQSDIFSAGLVLYEAILGPRPRPQKQEEWLGRMCLQPITPMVIQEPRIPCDLSSAIDRMLCLDPHRRPTATEAAAMMRNIANGNLQSDWPHPPKFIGRTDSLATVFSAFEPKESRMMILEGNVGTGRRRLLDQVQRRALLYGTPRVTGVCRPHISGGAVFQILSEIFATHADPEWRVAAAGPDAATLISMWPSLPLPNPDSSAPAPTMNEVAAAAANTIQRSVESVGLMVVFERIDAIDSLSARVLQMVLLQPPDRLAVMGVMEPRWATPRAQKLVQHLEDTDRAVRINLPPLSSPEATDVAAALTPEGTLDPIDGTTPQMARGHGLDRLAARRGEVRARLPASLAVLGLSARPLSREVLHLLHIDPLPWVEDGILIEGPKGYKLANGWLRQRAQSLISNRTQAEDALADAMVRAGVTEDACGLVARHMMLGRDPNRALPYAIRAAVFCTLQGRFNESRNWLMAIDPMRRDRNDPTYKALRFQLAWARARTSLNTDLSRNRDDLVRQAEERMRTSEERLLVTVLQSDVGMREGRVQAAIDRMLDQAGTMDETATGWLHLKAARMYLDLGDPKQARSVLPKTAILGAHPNRAVVGIDLARLEGRTDTVIEGCHQAIARSSRLESDPFFGILQCRLGWGLLARGDRVGATQSAHLAIDLLAEHGNRARLAEAHHLAALLALGRGQPRAARMMLDPLISTARSFSFTNLEMLGSSLKLRVAAAMGDATAAHEALDSPSNSSAHPTADWRLALSRWNRTQRRQQDALESATLLNPRNPAEVFLAIEGARLRLVADRHTEAAHHIEAAIKVCQKRGYSELLTLARVVHGAIDLTQDEFWRAALIQASASPWVELSMAGIAMQGRRALREGDNDAARSHFANLLRRADHLDHHYHRVVANEALVDL